MFNRYKKRNPMKNFPKYKTLEKWEARKKTLKQAIKDVLRVDVSLFREAPEVIYGAVIVGDGYTVRNLLVKSFEGYYIRANLYLPERKEKDVPAIILANGHFKDGRFNEGSQLFATAMARRGAAVINYDMVGQGGDTVHEHNDKYNNTVQLYNSMRVADYISSLDFIDKSRIGMAGVSGGGTQTVMLTAIDERITAAAPMCMVSAVFDGGCLCETGMRLFDFLAGAPMDTKRRKHQGTNVEYISMFAPKPLLLVSIGGDWTVHTPYAEYPYIKDIYSMYGAAQNVSNAHFSKERHDFGFSKRNAAADFFIKNFRLEAREYTAAEDAGVVMNRKVLNMEVPLDELKTSEEMYREIVK